MSQPAFPHTACPHRLICIAAAVLLLASASAFAANAYLWPLDTPPVLTSSFAEYRPGRFHAGIDLSTNGANLPVKAPSTGHITRLRCSPWGYGKAVYLQLADGNTVVFGHLSGFAPEIQAYVQAAQHKAQDYTVDLTVPATAFPIAAGQVVAFTGQTGIGPPHLHYELRDAQGRPINLRKAGIAWLDADAPLLRHLLVFPEGPETRINGAMTPTVFALKPNADGIYTCAPITIRGRVGFAVDVVDPSNSGQNRLGVYTASLSVQGADIFSFQNDCVSYDRIADGAVAFYPFEIEGGPYITLWRWPGNRSEPYAASKTDGWWAPPENGVELTLDTQDFAGNHATAAIPILGDIPLPETEPVASASTAATVKGTASITCLDRWVLVTVTFTGPETQAPLLAVENDPACGEIPMNRISRRLYQAGYTPGPDAKDVVLRVNHPRVGKFERALSIVQRGAGRAIDFNGMQLAVDAQSPFATLFVRGYTPSSPPVSPIRMLTSPMALWPEDAPIDAAFTMTIPAPAGIEHPERVHIYRRNASGWSRLDTQQIAGGSFSASTDRFGTYVLMDDDKPPKITRTAPASGASVTEARPVISATITDEGSGIKTAYATCNGKWMLMEYDPEQNLLEWARDEDLSAGPQEWVITVKDAAGNVTTESWTTGK